MRPRSYLVLLQIILLATLSVTTLRGISETLALNQLFFFVVGILSFWLLSAWPWRHWENQKWLWYGGVVALLIIILIIGTATKGSVSWLRFGSYRLQPSEFLKPALLLILATEFQNRSLKHWSKLAKFVFITFLPLGLILLQPDLGTALTITAGVGTLFLLLEPPRKILMILSLGSLVILVSSWLFFLKPYQKDRILTFVRPEVDVRGSGYNAQQAMIAVGSGGWWGQGWGEGRQSHLRFLPERQTDFLFATYAEEQGFMGSAALVLLYGSLFFSLIRQARSIENQAAFNFAIATLALLFVQTFINIGMNIGLTPVTGIPLPLFSLGGSSLLSTCIILGLLESQRRSYLPVSKRFH
jgi:rod shape determining protein RodA